MYLRWVATQRTYLMDGKLEGSASPRIKVGFYGMTGKQNPPLVFDAIIDTGFTGFVSIPIAQALPLGLMLFSTASFILADNSTENTFLCIGNATLGNKDMPVIFSLTKGRDILVGTDFLGAFNVKLDLDYKTRTFSLKVQEPNPPVIPPETKPKS